MIKFEAVKVLAVEFIGFSVADQILMKNGVVNMMSNDVCIYVMLEVDLFVFGTGVFGWTNGVQLLKLQ